MAKKTYGDLFQDIVDQAGLTNTFSDGLTETRRIKRDVNQIIKQVLSLSKTYLKKAGILVSGGTVATQNSYTIPTTIDKITSVMITDSSTNYYPKEISIDKFHTFDNADSSSDIPVYWTVDKTKLYIYPTPETSLNPIELNSNEFATDLNTDPAVTTDQTTALEIKEGYENVIYYYALKEAFRRLEDFTSAREYKDEYRELFIEYKKEVKSPTNSIVVGGTKTGSINPNYYTTFT